MYFQSHFSSKLSSIKGNRLLFRSSVWYAYNKCYFQLECCDSTFLFYIGHLPILIRPFSFLGDIFLCIKRVRLNWNSIVNDVQSATYSSHGAPCPARDLFPWLTTRVKVHMSLWAIHEYPKRHFRYLSDSGDTFLPLNMIHNEEVNYSFISDKIL